ncbi:hypothetical protein [Kineosporia babensis]|uniref:Uncharacterized protein n=1 Tax=Kineosporia babensis TaxID=499548 RepID=A0A9X1NED7_9ACTN|nr:hypothetical protein [Kineosporia babensis]MCD5311766.1 hypothetical protein [Kineosporia babensis]
MASTGLPGPIMAPRPTWAMDSWHDGTYLGTYLLAGRNGWERWYDAQGPLDTRRLALALDASPEVLRRLGDIPMHLRGLSLVGLPATDQDIQLIARRCKDLRWLDLRGTQVTAAGLDALKRLRSLRHIGVDPHLLLTRDPNGRQQLIAGSQALIPVASGVPEPDLVGLHESLRTAVKNNPSAVGARGPDEAVARARVLLDAGQAEAGLAMVGSFLVTGEPAVLIVTARCLLKQGLPLQALAALAQAPPTGAVLAWRAVVLTTINPSEAARVAKAALRETIENQVAEWALVTAYLNRSQLVLAEDALNLLRSRTYDEIDEGKLSARLARAKRHYQEEAEAWQRLLTVSPDDADALAGLSRAQRSAHPYSLRWVRTLNRAATADVGKYGRRMMDQVSAHRRGTAITAGVVSFPILVLVFSAWAPVERHVWGWALAVAILIGNLVGLAIWFTTPREVRRVIVNSDKITGGRHRPSRKAMLIGAVIAVSAVAFIPANNPGSARSDDPAAPRLEITIPPVPTVSFSFPSLIDEETREQQKRLRDLVDELESSPGPTGTP